jgi:hypothetical protein
MNKGTSSNVSQHIKGGHQSATRQIELPCQFETCLQLLSTPCGGVKHCSPRLAPVCVRLGEG